MRQPSRARPRWGGERADRMERMCAGALGMCIMRATGMDALERWFVLLAASGLLGIGATIAWVLADGG